MTSEVLILNRRAAVIAADSAITSSRGASQPRYSKSATKIFDLTEHGSVGTAFFGNALLDLVPWELAIKQFRRQLGKTVLPKTSDYLTALVQFLSANEALFPQTLLDRFTQQQFDSALLKIVQLARDEQASIFDVALPIGDRQMLWRTVAQKYRQQLNDSGVMPSLSAVHMDAAIADADWTERCRQQLVAVSDLEAIDPAELAELAHRLRYCRIDMLLASAGVIVVGYGESEVFPAYRQIEMYGHVGNELAYVDVREFQVSHTDHAMIQPLAQTSMIDMFTDGFGSSLQSIIERASRRSLEAVISDLDANGIQVPAGLSDSIIQSRHDAFMLEWRKENWAKNFTPLVTVIATLDVQEMAHLAETLLVLESLKERVTSPSEEVGGPIDVAAITKSEGLVWIKRKHYFDSAINLRYSARLRQEYVP